MREWDFLEEGNGGNSLSRGLGSWNWQGMETLIVLLVHRVQAFAWQRRLRDGNEIWVEEKGSVKLNSMAHKRLYWFHFLKHTCFCTFTHISVNPGPACISRYQWLKPRSEDVKGTGVCLSSGGVCGWVGAWMHARTRVHVSWVGGWIPYWFLV